MKNTIKLLVAVCFGAGLIAGCAPKTTIKESEMAVNVRGELKEGQQVGPKKKIAVIAFDNKTAYGQTRLGTAASDILTTELGKSGRFILIERDKMDKILAEKKLQTTGAVAADQIASSGKVLGLNAIVTGSISQFGVKTEGEDYLVYESKKQIAEATVDLRIVDVSDGKILWTDSGKGVAQKKVSATLGMGGRSGYDETLEGEALRAAIVKFVNNIIDKIDQMEWYCYVAEVDNDNIYLDSGKESGLAVNSKLKVTRPGKPIISKSTGVTIGNVENDVGMIEVVKYLGENGAVAKVVSGEKPQPGDICRVK
ncbi:MAG: hypothetical protein A2297_02445 [Elusimicrobia bacterium RIFOXYB2_FULL_48_7]|nr:MAG: hypothetical protein A2297_02445 [Elusimicrobia bacterium RIFOXYB2_FULL_48_7]